MNIQPDNRPAPLGFRLATPGSGLLILLLAFVVCLALASILIPLLMMVVKRPEAGMRIGTVVQDMLVFIIPAIIAAMLSTRLPAKLLAVDVKPPFLTTAMAVLTLIVSAPALNLIIHWNESIHLPESMAGLENWFRQMEEAAAQATDIMMAGPSLGSLIVSILIVGVLAGFSEELFFRGALQRLMMATTLGPHLCIWLTAFIFSAFHFQFFGFVPRFLLGAYFGYLLWWTRSLWVPMIVHIVNNSIVVLSEWHTVNEGGTPGVFDNFGADLSNTADIIAVAVSVVLTVGGLIVIKRLVAKDQHTAAVSQSGTDQAAR